VQDDASWKQKKERLKGDTNGGCGVENRPRLIRWQTMLVRLQQQSSAEANSTAESHERVCRMQVCRL
jgi:hypothetical protein